MNKLVTASISAVLAIVAVIAVIQHLHNDGEHIHSVSHDARLSLDNGQLWQSDEHTRQSMQRIDSLLNQQAHLDSLDKIHSAGNQVHTEIQNLIEGCKMEGPAHDQLHIYLGMLIPRVNSVQESTDLKTAEQHFSETRNLVRHYFEYFK